MTEDLILKNVTRGKIHGSSLVFHFVCNDENHEFYIKKLHSKTLNLRLVKVRKV